MYGYEPRRRPPEQGSCREALLFSWIALSVVIPWLAWLLFGMGLVIAAILLLIVSPWLALIPLGVLALLLAAIVVRDRRLQREAEAAARGEDGPRRGRR